MNRGGLYRVVSGLIIVLVSLAFVRLFSVRFGLDLAQQAVIGYFMITFGVFTALLHAWAQSLSGTTDEKGKGKKAIGGLVAHFAGSLAILLLYFFLFFRGSLFEVWTALVTYVISFVVFTILLSRMR